MKKTNFKEAFERNIKGEDKCEVQNEISEKMRKLGWMLIVLPFLVACGGCGNEGSDSENGTEKLEPQSAEARQS